MTQIPNSPAVWIVAIVALALVVALMIWRGVGGRFKLGGFGFSVNDARKAKSKVVVAADLKAEHSKVGNVTGVETAGATDAPLPEVTEVASRAEFSNTEVGDLTGVKITGPKGDSET